jgi:adenylosuccinate lyase
LIERYTLPEMGNLWSEEAKFQSWLDVEIAATEANCELGNVPAEAVATIKAKAAFSVERILEIEAEVRHDVIAFLTNVNEHVGDAGRYIHVGMTSSDVLDTGLALQLKASVQVLRAELDALAGAIRSLAREHKGTVMIGRSHAIHGEPITFGFKLAGWLAEVERNLRMMDAVIRHMSVLLAKDLDAEAIAVDPEEIKVRRIEVTDADDDADETFEASLGLADVERPVHVHAPVQSQPAPEPVEVAEVPTPAGDA